ncbi:putative beta-lysine N-acetyltransferase [Bacillus solimangrovi]|uniref:Putative beta-lysine N-acetyltransferase n=1 Tax=Bacillus solimangrovi TaxID=1305675 RepID=A0A1E5LHQ4_9BACI|nr:putative beta-lysine N-acetyltransferase [Bacillus solimangrovi]OEH93613.1 putative beta-lysine N-acetyltransferase [Bacillus solimangrovi]
MIIQQTSNKIDDDRFNERIVSYLVEVTDETIQSLLTLQKQTNASKLICFTMPHCVNQLQHAGFSREGRISGFFKGQDGIMMTKYFHSEREESNFHKVNEDVMEIVQRDQKQYVSTDIMDNTILVEATEEDAIELARLYEKVFKFYPTNVHDPKYLREQIGSDYVFVVMKENGKIISAASAYIQPEYNCAEITDCVTDPDYRGNSLLSPIVIKLEEILKEKQIQCAYSLTRAQSVGMNLTVKRLGYTYEGRLKNNCKIFTGFEDMNIWTKQIDVE